MRKIIIVFSLLLFLNNVFSQNTKTDTLNIAFKAKLLTVSKNGVSDSLTILKSIETQKLNFIPNNSKNIFLIKIEFGQDYYLGNKGNSLETFGEYNYYLAYNDIFKKFYRLGGFDAIDIDEFFKDLEKSSAEDKIDLLYKGDGIYDDFDFDCLENYHNMKSKHKQKKGFNCFENCSKSLFTKLFESNSESGNGIN